MPTLPEGIQAGRGEGEGVRVCRREDEPLSEGSDKVGRQPSKGECQIESRGCGQVPGRIRVWLHSQCTWSQYQIYSRFYDEDHMNIHV